MSSDRVRLRALHSSTMSLDGEVVAPRAPVAAVVRVVHPPELRLAAPVGATAVTLGRLPGPDTVVVAHATVSRAHARIVWLPDGHHAVRDLGSRHGTVVGSAPVGDAARPLADGDVLRLGDVLAVYELAAGRDPAEVDREALPGASPAMVRLREQVAAAAGDPLPVLVLGDTGTGKEWVARELHRLSRRRGPLVAVNCATLTAQLAESQLFGHVRGAFTGATAEHDGWFRQADGGTLFLDEIGELPLDLQPKLLRVVQDGLVQPLGAPRPVAVDVRLCAATHRPLADEVEAGRFRRDLHARLARLELRLPALAARRGDVVAWVERLWSLWFRERGGEAPPLVLKPAAAAAIVQHGWPDNLRGVDRLVHELARRPAPGAPVEAAELPAWLTMPAPAAEQAARPDPAPARQPVPSRDEFLAAWSELGGSVRAMARHFGRDRRQIYRWLAQHGVRDAVTDD